jgi:tetratricopeptide (TPR) repeat protein
MAEVDHAYKVFLEGNNEQALALFEGLVGKYPDHFAGRRALAFVSRCLYKLNRRNETVARMNQLVQNHAGKEVFGLAQSFTTGELVKNRQYAEAIATSQTILNDFPKTTLAKYALYDLGSIYWYRLEDQKTGEAYYRQLIADWPDDDLTISALATLGEWKPALGKGNAPALTKTQNVPAKYALSQNFPNPFNPQTLIQYQLPEASHIILKIYNLFGQEVRTLVAGQREAGYHVEIWDGRNDFGEKVASGVYFYRLSAGPNATQPNGFQFTRKMVLTQ